MEVAYPVLIIEDEGEQVDAMLDLTVRRSDGARFYPVILFVVSPFLSLCVLCVYLYLYMCVCLGQVTRWESKSGYDLVWCIALPVDQPAPTPLGTVAIS